jgi:uroporphyrinogen-III synthase
MHLIVTRPQPDAEDLQRKLEIRGHRVSLAPLLDIRMEGQRIPNRSYQAVLLTSANGARALARHPARDRLSGRTCYAVGPQSRSAALAAGFTNVVEAGGTVTAIAERVQTELEPNRGPLLYLSGEETSGDVEAVLKGRGFEVDRVIMYAAVPATHLPPAISSVIRRRAVDGVMLYSRRTAGVWGKCIEAHGLEPFSGTIIHLCLSASVAAALPSGWRVEVASLPSEQGMFDLVERVSRARAEG